MLIKLQHCIVAIMLCGAGSVLAQTDSRSRMTDVPLASTHADIAFTMMSGSRQMADCAYEESCPEQAALDAAKRFGLQVKRVSAVLQAAAQSRYPELATDVPKLNGGRFDVYVVMGRAAGSSSSANGRIALNSGLGTWPPFDDALAFIIAREMGHVIARHHQENSSASIATSLLMSLLIPGSGLLKSALSAGGSGIAAISKREVQALEADAIAIELLQVAGFRLGNVSLSLIVSPELLNDSRWSRNFKKSSDTLLAKVSDPNDFMAYARADPPVRYSVASALSKTAFQ